MRTHSTIGPKLVVIACLLASAFPVSVLAQEASPPIEALSLTSVCVDDPAVQRRWQIDNPNDLDVEVIWQVVETDQTATVTAPPGASFIFTTTVEGPNIVVIVWYDENGVEQSDVASGGVECERGACFIENYMDTGRCNCLILAQYLCEALEGGTYQGDHTVCDSDNDGVFGCDDLCPGTPEDEDANEDGCSCSQLDDDQDGANNCIDNCLETSNPDQADLDGDGIGDVCDGDRDGDGVPNDEDNCPDVSNADQADADGDGIGDVCDGDRDGDGVPNNEDNCPDVSNADQADADGNGVGDACDDRDGDGVPDDEDNCPDDANPSQADADGDGVGDVCEEPDSGGQLPPLEPEPEPQAQPQPANQVRIPFLWQSVFGWPLCGPGCLLPACVVSVVGMINMKRHTGRRRRRRL